MLEQRVGRLEEKVDRIEAIFIGSNRKSRKFCRTRR